MRRASIGTVTISSGRLTWTFSSGWRMRNFPTVLSTSSSMMTEVFSIFIVLLSMRVMVRRFSTILLSHSESSFILSTISLFCLAVSVSFSRRSEDALFIVVSGVLRSCDTALRRLALMLSFSISLSFFSCSLLLDTIRPVTTDIISMTTPDMRLLVVMKSKA